MRFMYIIVTNLWFNSKRHVDKQDSEALSQKDNEYDLESQESVGGALLDKERGKTTQRPAGSLSTASSPPASTSPQPLVKDNSEQVKGAKQEKAAKTVKRAADTKPEEKKVEVNCSDISPYSSCYKWQSHSWCLWISLHASYGTYLLNVKFTLTSSVSFHFFLLKVRKWWCI